MKQNFCDIGFIKTSWWSSNYNRERFGTLTFRFSFGPFVRANGEVLTPETSASPSFHGDNSTFVNLFDKTKTFVTLKTAALLSFSGGNLIFINLFEFHISTEAAPQFLRNKCTYQLLPLASPPGNPWTRRGNGTVLVLIFSPQGRGVL